MRLIDAARAGDPSQTRALIAKASNGERIAALHAAAQAGHVAVVDQLIPTIDGRLYVIQALVPAVRGAQFDCIRRLIGPGTSVTRCGMRVRSARHQSGSYSTCGMTGSWVMVFGDIVPLPF